MSDWIPRIVILALLGVVVGVPFAMKPASSLTEEKPRQLTLVIMSPHNEQIRYEFSRAFNEWRKAQGKPTVAFDWRSSGGTSEQRKQVLSEYALVGQKVLPIELEIEQKLIDKASISKEQAAAIVHELDRVREAVLELENANAVAKAEGKSPVHDDAAMEAARRDSFAAILKEVNPELDTKAVTEALMPLLKSHDEALAGTYDLFFGGGAYDHGKLASGTTVDIGGEKMVYRVTRSPRLDPDFFKAVYPEPTISGEPLYKLDKETGQLQWAGAALSSFGIIYNTDAVDTINLTLKKRGETRQLEMPTTWSDLADPAYEGWVGLADPLRSSSTAAAFEILVKRMGWDDGWATLRRAYANARYFSDSATKVPLDVSYGHAGLGVCIDFYGRYQAQAVPNGRAGYVEPPFMTSITADPITMMRGAPNDVVAREFFRFVLSKEGQRIWQRHAGSEGGPEKYELRRLPVRYDMYHQMVEPGKVQPKLDPVNTEEMASWTDDVLPWRITEPMPDGTPAYFSVIDKVSAAIGIDSHEDLNAAWRVIIREKDPAVKAEMLKLFDAMPEDLRLNWPADFPADQWREIMKDENHPLHRQAKDFLNNHRKNISDYWKNQSDLLGDKKPEEINPWKILRMRERHRDAFEVTLDEDLKKVWVEAIQNAEHTQHQAVMDKAKPFVTELLKNWDDKQHVMQDRLEWTAYFRANYRKIVEMNTQ